MKWYEFKKVRLKELPKRVCLSAFEKEELLPVTLTFIINTGFYLAAKEIP
jgi:hypothetical protein